MQDPFLWIDPKTGAFHVISHAYPGGTDSVLPYDYGDTVGGHAFSVDGLTWIWSTMPPFTRYVETTAGKNRTRAYKTYAIYMPLLLALREVWFGSIHASDMTAVCSVCCDCSELRDS